MASYGYHTASYHPHIAAHPHNNHHGRSRRGPRVSSQNAHRQYKAQKSPKEMPETPVYSEYLQRMEAARSFEFDDDEQFCPFHLLTDDDLQSIHSAAVSERGSMSSGSPDGSPQQHQAQPTPSFLLSSVPNAYNPVQPSFQQHNMKLHQPMAQRARNAIPIVDPTTRTVASPPLSVSPARQMQHQQQQHQQYITRRW